MRATSWFQVMTAIACYAVAKGAASQQPPLWLRSLQPDAWPQHHASLTEAELHY